MFNQQQQQSYIKTSKIENIPGIKISLFNEKSNLEINRIFMPIDSTFSSEKIFNNIQNKNDQISTIENFEKKLRQSSDNFKILPKLLFQQSITNIPSTSRKNEFNKKIIQYANIVPLSKIQQLAYNHGKIHPTSTGIVQKQQNLVVPINFINKYQLLSSKIPLKHFIINTNKTYTHSPVIRVEQSLTPPHSQLFPDSIINDKQTTNRIFNEKISTHFTHLSKLVTLTPIKTSSKYISESIDNDSLSLNQIRYYRISSIFTSTSTFIMHQNKIIAHSATTAVPFLSDTIFIILIATLTIIILLFCLGLFCLCRRTTKRNISPSFDGGSYVGLNGHSFEIPIDNYQQRISKYENDIPYITDIPSSSIHTRSSINHSPLTNDRILLPQTIALHHTAKQKAKMSKKKLKKKRVGFCCCNSKQTTSTTINARTRIKRNEI